MVYAFGLLTLMARNLEDDGDEDNHLANNIISYFPILPSMQVISRFNSLQLDTKTSSEKSLLIFCI